MHTATWQLEKVEWQMPNANLLSWERKNQSIPKPVNSWYGVASTRAVQCYISGTFKYNILSRKRYQHGRS